MSWYAYLMRIHPKETYGEWCKELYKNCKSQMDGQRMKIRFNELQQNLSQQVQQFMNKLMRMYDSIYKTPKYEHYGTKKKDTNIQVFNIQQPARMPC